LSSQTDDEYLNFRNSHFGRMALAPIDIRLFGAIRIVFCPDRITELVE
jgi:hypothetical protein